MTIFGDLALVPGSGCDGRLFTPQVEALQGTVRTHLVENTEQPRIDRLARTALDRLPDRFALAGLSQGGLVALEIVRQAPERVTGLALLDTLPGPGLRVDRVRHRLAIAMLAVRAFGPMRHWLQRIREHADTPPPATEPSTPRTTP